ncbi:MAG TPA: NAD(P)H-hydrate dehydratase [Pyrinomonadaceae bacterium]|jgi:hydroxyethylthiazole kinase-like uncharacterized protein yjeF|nr:NAD(P)H-hydrate dehydratase [Pyrinomonadaceae bacterium]
MKKDSKPTIIGPAVLRRMPVPEPLEEDDKEARGRVLVVGGSREMPGALVLAATAALRAGAGKLRIATVRSVASLVAASVPEARVFHLPETKSGALGASAVAEVAVYAGDVQAVCIGPGMIDERATTAFVKKLLPRIESAVVVLDADALNVLARDRELLHVLEGRAVVTPHAEEMAGISGVDKSEIADDALNAARRAATELRAVVVLKGRETFIVGPTGKAYSNRAGNVGLATSGSGDVLSGLIAGLAARGAEALTAAVWGVHLHALAGDLLAERVGKLGFLARELPGEIPRLMSDLSGGKR